MNIPRQITENNLKEKDSTRILLATLFFAVLYTLAACALASPAPLSFDGKRAYTHIVAQTKMGFRPVGSSALKATGDYIITQMKGAGWKIETQEFSFRNASVRNIIGKIGEGRGPLVVVGAHYDTRVRADQDKAHPELQVMGGNDAASGVAVLLELAHTLDAAKLKNEVWFTFFDAEDNGDISGCIVTPGNCDNAPWPWSVGADYFAEHLGVKPSSVIILDMIGDADQNIYYEYNSDKETQERLWGIAAQLGYGSQFIQQYKWSMEDDHTPFITRGIRAVDMIDFDYPYWHTTQDTADKVSAESLERVGRVMKTWLENQK